MSDIMQAEMKKQVQKWPMVKLGEVVNFIGGAQPPKSTFKYAPEEGYTRLLQIRDYRTDSYPTYISTDSTKKFCTKEDIMIGRYGPPVFQILRGLEGAYNVALMKAVPCEKIDRNYLYYFLKQDKLFHLIDGLSQRTAGQSGIDMDALKAYPMLLPPLEEQKHIAAILDKADTIRRKRQQAIKLADDFLRAVFLDMFGDPVTNPKGWGVHRMGDVIDFKGGHQPPKDTFLYEPKEGYVRLIQIRDFKSDKYLTYIPEEKAKRHFEKDDVMIARYGPPVFQILRGLEGSYNVALMKAIPKGEILKSFIYYLLQVPAYHDVVVANSERTAGQTGVNLDLLNNFSLPLPPISEQEKIIKTMTQMEIAMKRFNIHGVCAEDLFDALSQKAFSGDL